jgi:hypothetical protein
VINRKSGKDDICVWRGGSRDGMGREETRREASDRGRVL